MNLAQIQSILFDAHVLERGKCVQRGQRGELIVFDTQQLEIFQLEYLVGKCCESIRVEVQFTKEQSERKEEEKKGRKNSVWRKCKGT